MYPCARSRKEAAPPLLQGGIDIYLIKACLLQASTLSPDGWKGRQSARVPSLFQDGEQFPGWMYNRYTVCTYMYVYVYVYVYMHICIYEHDCVKMYFIQHNKQAHVSLLTK